MRIGHGFDVHALAVKAQSSLAGYAFLMKKGCWPTDGDVALHALTDALLGAAALGDIGKLFPIPIRRLKAPIAANCCAKHGAAFRPRAIRSATSTSRLLPCAPKMLPHIPQMRVFIAEDLGCHMDDVNVKATTTEKLGFTGRGKGSPAKRLRCCVRPTNDRL